MKKLIYIFLILLGFTSCMKDDKVTMEPDATDKVDIYFGVDLPEPITKAMADNPQVQNLRVAVFGGSGYLKEYVQADPVELATTNETKYTYKVRLSLSDSYLKVHFIANGPETLPFKYEDEVMSVQTTSGNQDAYWQKIELPHGITAKKDADGVYIKVNGEYQVSDETKAHFQDIPLVRNFAKIQVIDETDDFDLESYAIVNKPSMGSIAAYNKKTNAFVMNYQDSTLADLKEWYPGNMPAAATIDKTIPAASAFTANPVYMYERPIPTEDATFLIIYGKYNNDNKYYYYRIELQDADGYYAIYRNWVYTVKIKGIVRPGAATPTDAANSSGSGDVSTDQKAENLTDVSDGVARIYVEYTEKTLVGQGTVTLKFKFLPDATVSTPANNQVTVTVGEAGGTGAVIDGAVTIASSDDSDGWRQLSFTSTTPTDVTKTQTIRVTGTYGTNSKLFRNVTYKLMSIQNMQVVCDPHDLIKGKGEKVDVLIKIPKDLPRSIFPLQLQIESSALSITPDNDNLPVQPGKSIVTGHGTTSSYQFIKTLNYDDYLALQDVSTDDWVTVRTHFKTTKDAGDCDVYVANEYFHTAHDSFITYTVKDFSDLAFSSYSQSDPDMPVTFSFKMDATDVPQKVTLKLSGLKPGTGSTLVQVGTNTYEYSTGGNSTASISLLTSTDEGYYMAEISAPHYNDASLDNLLEYVNPKFTGTSVAAGKNQNVPFTFSYQSTSSIEPVTFTLTNLTTSDTRFEHISGNVWKFTPNTTTNVSQTITFQTTGWYPEVSVSMSGDSYWPAGPFSLASPASAQITQYALRFTNRRNSTISVYNSSGTVITTISTDNDGDNRNAFTLNRDDFEDDVIYFSYTQGGNTYYSIAYSISALSSASYYSGTQLSIATTNSTRP